MCFRSRATAAIRCTAAPSTRSSASRDWSPSKTCCARWLRRCSSLPRRRQGPRRPASWNSWATRPSPRWTRRSGRRRRPAGRRPWAAFSCRRWGGFPGRASDSSCTDSSSTCWPPPRRMWSASPYGPDRSRPSCSIARRMHPLRPLHNLYEPMTTRSLVEALDRGDTAALARAISLVENRRDGCEQVLTHAHARVGRTELDIARTAESTALVLVPESGDAIQTLKAGVMEIADVFVINKSDRPGGDKLRQEIEVMLGLRQGNAFRNLPAHHHRSDPKGLPDGR